MRSKLNVSTPIRKLDFPALRLPDSRQRVAIHRVPIRHPFGSKCYQLHPKLQNCIVNSVWMDTYETFSERKFILCLQNKQIYDCDTHYYPAKACYYYFPQQHNLKFRHLFRKSNRLHACSCSNAFIQDYVARILHLEAIGRRVSIFCGFDVLIAM